MHSIICGNYSLQPWISGGVGLCFFHLYLNLPLSLLYIALNIFYGCMFRRFSAFGTSHSRILRFRSVLDLALVCSSLLGFIFACTTPMFDPVFERNSVFEAWRNLISLLVWMTMFNYDFQLGRTYAYSSRGPFIHLCCSIFYFYACVVSTWSSFAQISMAWRPYLLGLCCLNLFLVSVHLLLKIPVIYAVEEPRRQEARLARSMPNPVRTSPQFTFGDSVLSLHYSQCSDSYSYLSNVFFTWIGPTITSGFFGELSTVYKLPQLPNRLNILKLESVLTFPQQSMLHEGLDDEQSVGRVSVIKIWPFIRALFNVFGKEFITLGCVKFFISLFSLSGPVFLNYFIIYLSSSTYLLAPIFGSVLVLITFISSIVGTNYNYYMSSFNYKVRLAVTGSVFRRILSIKLAALNTSGTGALINYLTSDTDRIVNLANCVHELWAMPLQLVVAIGLLYNKIGVSCFVGVGFLTVLLPLNRCLANRIGIFSRRLMLHKDVRIKIMAEVLSSMNPVKLACFEKLMHRRINKARLQELKALWGQKLLDAICVFFWAACPALLASSTFATYVSLGNQLEASMVFTSLALFGMLIGPMNALPWVINGVMEATVSLQRVSSLFRLDVGPFPRANTEQSLLSEMELESSIEPIDSTTHQVPIQLSSSSFAWSKLHDPALSDITLNVQKGQLVGICGPVGCGKSTLLLGILGELEEPDCCDLMRTDLPIDKENIIIRLHYAYVGQSPWICAGTIRSNIVFGAPYNEQWLDQVVSACALVSDLAHFPHGLDTDVGEGGGSRLSGGQRARVALARAVYQQAEVYILDDPLSALDPHVAQHVIRDCIFGLLAGKTRLIATSQLDWLIDQNHPAYIRSANVILEIADGRIINQSLINPTLDSSLRRDLAESSLSGETATSPTIPVCEKIESDTKPIDLSDDDDCQPLLASHTIHLNASADRPDHSMIPSVDPTESSDASNWERLAFGSISTDVYRSYLRAAGYCLGLSIILSLFLMQATRNASDWWLSKWVQDSTGSYATPSADVHLFSELSTINAAFFYHPAWNNNDSRAIHLSSSKDNATDWFYLKVYGAIVAGNMVATVFRAVLFAFGGLAAARTIHKHALSTILCARSSYFDRTPQGRILNRFSSDVGTIDDGLPFQLNILLADIAGLLGVIVISCIALPMLFFILMPLVFVFWSVQRAYRGAARDLKRLSSVTRSPVYAHFSDTLNGLVVIRGLGQERRFRLLAARYLAAQLRAELAGLAAGAWLGIRLQIIATTVVAGVVCVSLLGRFLGWTQVAVAGLSAAYALNIAGLMTNTVYDATETEKSLVAVERCQELTDETPVEPDTVPTTVTAPVPSRRNGTGNLSSLSPVPRSEYKTDWPSAGQIQFSDVSLIYRLRDLDNADHTETVALQSVNLLVQAGERVGIVGRTGSGKSSLVRVLMRLVDHLPGPFTDQRIAKQMRFSGATGKVFIDGVDIRTVPLTVLRSRVLAVCQEPFLFSGCLRDNLDPENTLCDDILCEVLCKCQLARTHSDAMDWLSRNMGEAGRDVSAGQRQLICLARALLRQPRPRIICLDEATASVDHHSEAMIHEILNKEFSNSTVILIAHRISSVRQFCSRVIVLQSGSVVADGDPENVLSDNDTVQSNLDTIVSNVDLIQF